MSDLDEVKQSELNDLLARCYADTKFMGKTLFPSDFYAPFSSLHNQIFDLIDANKWKKKRKVVISAPRGIGKTTIAELLCKKYILFNDSHFVVYISNSETSAERQTQNVKLDLLTNDDTKRIFQPIKAANPIGLDDQFSKKAWVASGRTLVLPRGSGQQIRGLKWIRWRPNVLIIDDLENAKEIRSEYNREENKRWFFADVIKTINRYLDEYLIFYIDTIKHEDALITHLLDDPDWESLQLSVCDENYKTLAPDFMTQEELDSELDSHRRQHIMDIFAMEFMSMPTSKEDAPFKGEYFKYYNEDDDDFISRKPFIENLLIVDPAATAKVTNAQTAFVIWGIDIDKNRFYVRLAKGMYLHPDEMHAEALRLADRYNVSAIGFDDNGLKEHLLYPFRNYMLSKGRFHHIVELTSRAGKGTEYTGYEGGKIGRIANGLGPFYREGVVYHNNIGTGPLEQQLLSFPKSRLWDIMDAAAYLPQMLDKGLRYFKNKKVSEKPEDIEKEYEVLKNEPALDNSWQVCP